MRYNPEEKQDNGGGGKAAPGRYRFKIDDAKERLRETGNAFNSGSEGLECTLLVGAGNRDVKVFARFVYLPQSLWKLEQFMESVGLDFHDKSLTARDFYGLTGEAEFVAGEKGYLEADEFYPASANNGPQRKTAAAPSRTKSYQPQSEPSEDVPF